MPELPEVETVKRTLNELVVGKTITKVSVLLNRIIRKPEEPSEFATLLEGQTINRIERRGKFLCFMLSDYVLVSHLRMEGRYGVYGSADPVELHTHVIFHFTDGTDLRYKDVRQFGTMHLFPAGAECSGPPLHKLGVEPLHKEFTIEELKRRVKGRSTKIKPLLLNQEIIVGIGNIYADESLYLAGIHPARAASSLTSRELARLHKAIIETLQAAVDAGGSSIKSYVNGQGEMGMFQYRLNAYGRKNEPCGTCGCAIEKIVLCGRGTHFCPVCQPVKRKKKAE